MTDRVSTNATSEESRLFWLQVGRNTPLEAEVIDFCTVLPFKIEIVAIFTSTTGGELKGELTIDGVPVELAAVDNGEVTNDTEFLSEAGPYAEYRPTASDPITADTLQKLQLTLFDLSTGPEKFECTIWCRRAAENDTGE